MPRRYVIYGAGAIGGTIGGLLHETGREVVLIARGAHLEALRTSGLLLRDPERSRVIAAPVAASPGAVDWRDGDVVVLGMKAQDTLDAVRRLPADVPVVCAQNGVENERAALRHVSQVYGMCVLLPATHLEPGHVDCHASDVAGALDVGRYPHGVDDLAHAVAADLTAAGFLSRPRESIMRFKYLKLLMNLGNAIEAACGPAARRSDLYERARTEGVSVFAAAGIDVASPEEDDGIAALRLRPVEGERRAGGSSWQSLARGTGSIEADYLNGEVVLLGRLHGVATPVNALAQRVANEMAARREPPGSRDVAELERELG